LTFAYLNDKNPMLTFAQQLSVMAKEGDVLITLSTSGNSKNCVYAAIVAKAKGVKTLFLGGGNGGKLKEMADVSIIVPEKETYKVQELHLPVYHCLCAMLEEEFF
jgi:D-sedoheptulose 7-phosphate isomerase